MSAPELFRRSLREIVLEVIVDFPFGSFLQRGHNIPRNSRRNEIDFSSQAAPRYSTWCKRPGGTGDPRIADMIIPKLLAELV
jgi:hypothetical protein